MKRNPEDLKKLFALRKRNGWTWRELAANSDVSLSTLMVWHRRLRQATEAQVRFAEVEVIEPTGPAASLHLILKCGTRIVVSPGFDPDHLRRVIAALDRTC